MSRSRTPSIVLAVVLVVGATAVAAWWIRNRDDAAEPATPPPALATAELVRKDMSTSVSLSGRLGHGTARPVKGSRRGILTWLPAPGTTRKRGSTLYRVDDEPVALFYGGTPLFRTLDTVNTVGRDVRMVTDNLKALGYPVGRRHRPGDRIPQTTTVAADKPATADEKRPATATTWVTVRKGEDALTPAVIRAIRQWRDDAGLPAAGSLGVGDVAVLPGAVRVESTPAQVGDDAETTVLTVTSTNQVVTVDLEPAAAADLHPGDKVKVRLPDEKTLPGHVDTVSTAVTDDSPKIVLTIALDGSPAGTRLTTAPVEVTVPGRTHRDVLAAPVGALVALAEGGYAVQIAGGPLVAVQTGIFADGLVEVDGTGVDEGTRVVTTS